MLPSQEMGPGKVKVRLSVNATFIIDEDDLEPIKSQGWDDTLRHLHQSGIPINKRLDLIKEKPRKKK